MPSLFETGITNIKGIGEKKAKLFNKLGLWSVGDLIKFYPRNYLDWNKFTSVEDAENGEVAIIKATIDTKFVTTRVKGGKLLIKGTASDDTGTIRLTFFNNKYIPNLLKYGETYVFRGRIQGGYGLPEMTSPEFISEEKLLSVQPVYKLTEGLTQRAVITAVAEALKMLPEEIKDPIPDEIRKKYKLCHLSYALNNIHFPKSMEEADIAKNRLVFEELMVLRLGLYKLRNQVKSSNLHKITKDYSEEFASLLPFSLTNAQKKTISEAVGDMMGNFTMNRLVQGDVGSGKTAVAVSLSYTVIKNGGQVAFMAPTEILANQHYESINNLLKGTGIEVVLLTGALTQAEKKKVYAKIESGEAKFIVGTHAVISERVVYNNLSLVITDEQHRFGVNQRSALAEKGNSPHTLVMSATPIPRTLAIIIYGDLDISILNELPPGRQKIETYVIDSNKRKRAFSFIKKHINEGRQAYIVCPYIEESESDSEIMSLEKYMEILEPEFMGYRIGVLHGKMKNSEKDEVMERFSKGELDILAATTVVEVGVDVPNSTIMMIENAENYGLSQLHQLRGRVGRGKYQSYCILVSDSENDTSKDRLKAIAGTSDGFKIAEYDLKMRGPGDFFGERQSGLPQIKTASLMENVNILHDAQEAADEIIAKDPDLIDPKHRMLKTATKALFKSGGIMLL
ncbi:MAG: ATP-dependent DNA helicase RecG [Ruminococcaceae bacterium]|nr:ATP-dependent DNA helicase RecG [Oscillospiraceae bacterium]